MAGTGAVGDDDENVERLTQEIVTRGGTQSDEAAAAMLIAGAPPKVIAEKLGFESVEAVTLAAERAMAGSLADADRTHLKRVWIERHERLWRAVQKRATDPSYRDAEKAMANALRLLDQAAGLLQIKPDQTVSVVHSADRATIDQWIKDVTQARIQSFPEELDVLDAEVIESEGPGQDDVAGADAVPAPAPGEGEEDPGPVDQGTTEIP